MKKQREQTVRLVTHSAECLARAVNEFRGKILHETFRILVQKKAFRSKPIDRT